MGVPSSKPPYRGYDDWTSLFPRSDEVNLICESIAEVSLNPHKRIHIRGISTAESVELVRAYYRECGYEDSLAKNYLLPVTVALTVSLSLAHTLWCEKDKNFLNSQYQGISYGEICPPVRTPHDLRALQQALRMGIIMGIEISPREHGFLSDLLVRQIVSPFHLSQ
jgi:dihydroorotase-like cyclic amidohydrolase